MATWTFDGRMFFEETDAGYLPIDARVSGYANGEHVADSLTRALVHWLGIDYDPEDDRRYRIRHDAEYRRYQVRITIETDESVDHA